jgi:hypothetical protein
MASYSSFGKTRHCLLDPRLAFRSNSEPLGSDRRECTAAAKVNCAGSTGQAPSAHKWEPHTSCSSCPYYAILETIYSYRSAGHAASLAPEVVSLILAGKSQSKPLMATETIALIYRLAKENALWEAGRNNYRNNIEEERQRGRRGS